MIALAEDSPFGNPPPPRLILTLAGSGVASSVCLLFHFEMFLAIYNPHCEQTFKVEREKVPASLHLPTPRCRRDDMRSFGCDTCQQCERGQRCRF